MRSSYRKIGDFIKPSKLKNEDGVIDLLLGVNLDKKFMPSVANINGVDLTKYKVIKKGQFGCKLMSVGRDKKVPVSRLTSYDEAIISSAYFVFEVIDENELNPEYLMMWFSRSESDRFQWFQSGADIRGRITWEEFCSLPIKVPSIENQREIVKEYNTIVKRIKLNEQLNQKLEETAQALYKHWFVDFEFPNENGQPYKSSGGGIVYNEFLDREIPVGWKNEMVKVFGEVITGKTPSSRYPEHFGDALPFVTPSDYKSYQKYVIGAIRKLSEEGKQSLNKKVLPINTLIVSCIGSDMGKIVVNSEPCITNQQINSLVPNNTYMIDFLYNYFKDIYKYLRNIATGSSTMLMINKTDFELIEILSPKKEICESFHQIVVPLNERMILNGKELISLKKMKSVILSKISKIESPITEQVL